MTAPDIVRAIAEAGGLLVAEDNHIRYQIPVKAKFLLSPLEEKKLEVLRLLSPLTETVQ